MKTRTLLSTYLLALAIGASASVASAQTIVGWNAEDAAVSLVSNVANITATNLTLGAGLTPTGNATANWRPNGFDQTTFSGAFTNNDYITFTITPDANYEVTIDSFTSNIWNISGPATTTTADLRISSDGFATAGNTTSLGTLSVPSGFGSNIIRTLSIASSYTFDTATEFRIYGITADSVSRNWNMGTDGSISPDITLAGSVAFAAVPEPSSYASILGFSAIGAFLVRRRRS